jgi:hypothetical protein
MPTFDYKQLPRTDIIIKKARRKSTNEDVGDEFGISQNHFIDALAEGVVEIQKAIVDERSEAFVAYKDITLTGAESYSVPSDAFVDSLVYDVFFSLNGVTYDEDPLPRLYRRPQILVGYPDGIFVDGGQMYLSPNPVSGTLRVRYEQALDAPDIRRGAVLSYTSTDITLDTATVADPVSLEECEFVSVVSPLGVINARGLPVTSYDSSSGILTLLSAQTLLSTESINAGDYICLGGSSTTHLQLPRFCESYLIRYMQNEMYLLDSSEDSNQSDPMLGRMLSRIVSIFSQTPGGLFGIAETRGE